jgi:hypothetical protein
MTEEQILEKFAAMCHEQWSGWTKWIFEKCDENKDLYGHVKGLLAIKESVIPKNFEERWKMQMTTDYKDLSEEDKEKDRREARKFLDILKKENMIFEDNDWK